MTTLLRWSCICTIAICLSAGGCGDDIAAHLDAGIAADAPGEDAAPAPLRVRVVYGQSVAAWQGAVGAVVAVDKPDGTREEKTADADGRVSFAGLDFTLGTATITAHLPGSSYPPSSWTGIRGADDEVLMYLWAFDEPQPTVQLSGKAVNLTGSGHRLLVSASNASTIFDSQLATWALPVRPDTPFVVAAVEYSVQSLSARSYARTWYAWAAWEHEAITADTLLDLDFAQAVAPKQTAGSVRLPARAESILRGNSSLFLQVSDWSSGGAMGLGYATTAHPSDDANSFEYTLDWIEPAGITTPITQYFVYVSTARGVVYANSFVIRAGYPTGGELDVVPIDPPALVVPEDTLTAQSVHAPIAWTPFEAGLMTRCFVMRDDQTVWLAQSQPDDTTLTFPRAPSSVDEAALLGEDDLTVNCQAIEAQPDSEWVGRGASLLPFLVHRD